MNVTGAVLAGIGFAVVSLGPAEAQRRSVTIDVDQDGRAVAVSNIERRDLRRECSRATGTGRVSSLQTGRDGLLDGVAYEDDQYGRSFVNINTEMLSASAGDKRRIDARLREILAVGNRVRLVTFGCGAGGRIEKLDAASVVSGPAWAPSQAAAPPATRPPQVAAAPAAPAGPPAPSALSTAPPAAASDNDLLRSAPGAAPPAVGAQPAASAGPEASVPVVPGRRIEPSAASAKPDLDQAAPTSSPRAHRSSVRWERSDFQNIMVAISATNTARTASVHLGCRKKRSGQIEYDGTIFGRFRDWALVEPQAKLLLDGKNERLEFQGSHGEVPIVNTPDNGLTRDLVARIAEAEEITIIGRDKRGRESPRSIFGTGGREALQWLERRCAALKGVH